MVQRKTFLPDDFERISNKYFKKLRATGNVSADPSYWFDQSSNVTKVFGAENLQRYVSDFYSGLKQYKNRIIKLIENWDNNEFGYDSITLCSSVTSGSLVILSSLKELGVEEIFFETPAYFASINQAEKLGFKVTLIPTYSENEYKIDPGYFIDGKSKKYALWVTQPRFALGVNQCKDDIEAILNLIGPDNYLVVDEATDQYFPTHLNEFNCNKHNNLIKVRSFFKGMGINGPRIAFILHSEELRSLFEFEIEKMQGSIDYFSLNFLYDLSADIKKFKTMLKVANDQVVENYETIEKISVGSLVKPSPLVNGYIGSVSIDLSHLNMKHLKSRETFLKYCHANQLPVIVGASMRFAVEEKREFVRLNYFNKPKDLFKGVEILSRFS